MVFIVQILKANIIIAINDRYSVSFLFVQSPVLAQFNLYLIYIH